MGLLPKTSPDKERLDKVLLDADVDVGNVIMEPSAVIVWLAASCCAALTKTFDCLIKEDGIVIPGRVAFMGTSAWLSL